MSFVFGKDSPNFKGLSMGPEENDDTNKEDSLKMKETTASGTGWMSEDIKKADMPWEVTADWLNKCMVES